MTTKCSVTLLKNGVSEIGLRSSSVSGRGIFPIAVTNSIFHCDGHSKVSRILLIIVDTGVASSGANSEINVLGMSPGTPDFGFFADSILQYTSYSLTVGVASILFNFT